MTYYCPEDEDYIPPARIPEPSGATMLTFTAADARAITKDLNADLIHVLRSIKERCEENKLVPRKSPNRHSFGSKYTYLALHLQERGFTTSVEPGLLIVSW